MSYGKVATDRQGEIIRKLERFQDRCALSIFNARSPLHGVGSTRVYALGYSNPETAIVLENCLKLPIAG